MVTLAVPDFFDSEQEMKSKIITIGAIGIIVLTVVAFHKNGMFPIMVISGRVFDENGRPINNARIHSQFGIAKDGSSDITDKKGSFNVHAWMFSWAPGKSRPSITATKEGYKDQWVYFDQWSWGFRYFKTEVVIHRKQK